jgi:hypothetical protein
LWLGSRVCSLSIIANLILLSLEKKRWIENTVFRVFSSLLGDIAPNHDWESDPEGLPAGAAGDEQNRRK